MRSEATNHEPRARGMRPFEMRLAALRAAKSPGCGCGHDHAHDPPNAPNPPMGVTASVRSVDEPSAVGGA